MTCRLSMGLEAMLPRFPNGGSLIDRRGKGNLASFPFPASGCRLGLGQINYDSFHFSRLSGQAVENVGIENGKYSLLIPGVIQGIAP